MGNQISTNPKIVRCIFETTKVLSVIIVIVVIANFARVISLTIEIIGIPEKANDNARTADDKVQHIAVDL